MRQLAEFEKYADDFVVTEHVLRELDSELVAATVVEGRIVYERR